MIDQAQFKQRLNGKLPTLSLNGHIFFVDVRLNGLRSSEDPGNIISFETLDDDRCEWDGMYRISYNTLTNTYTPLDASTITSIPDNTIVLEFPTIHSLDPIGWLLHCFGEKPESLDIEFILKHGGVRLEHTAKIIPWDGLGFNLEDLFEQNNPTT